MMVRDQFDKLLIQMLSDSLEELINYNKIKESEVEQPYEPPSAIKVAAQDYDLTFKKQIRTKAISRQTTQNIGRNIFRDNQQIANQGLLQKIRYQPLPSIFSANYDINELTQLKDQLILDQYMETKILMIICHHELVRNRKKRNSARMNYRILKIEAEQNKQEMSQADQYRLYLLQSLANQYNKRVFVDSLKFNYYSEQLSRQPQPQPIQNDDSCPQNLGIEQQQNPNPSYHDPNRLYIFAQIFDAIVDKRKFEIFKILTQYQQNEDGDSCQAIQHQQQYNGNHDDLSEEGLSISQSENPQFYINNQQGMDQHQIKTNRIRTINAFILEQAAKIEIQPQTRLQIMRNCFTKWKIYFLMNMVKLIKKDPDISNSNLNQGTQYPDSSYNQLTSYLPAQQSQINPLKNEKQQLKEFLRINRSRQFLKQLEDNMTDRQLRAMTKNLYTCNTLKKSFRGLVQNRNSAQYKRQSEIYAQQLANNQYNDTTMSVIFQKTNLLTKSFSSLVLYSKTARLVRVLSKTDTIIKFRVTVYSARAENKFNEKVQRFINKRNRIRLFKYFNGLKNASSYGQSNLQKLNNYLQKKNREILDYYFSLMKLLFKLKQKNIRKIAHMREKKQLARFFGRLTLDYEGKLETDQTVLQLQMILGIKQKLRFFNRMRISHRQLLAQRKIMIQGEKVKVWRLWKNAEESLQRLKLWNLQRKCQRAIEIRLRKYKEREQRQKIFKIWRQKLKQKQSHKQTNHNNHKIWLQKYYQQLCSIER